MKTAKEIKKLDGYTGDARLFELSEPVPYGYNWDTDQYDHNTNFVVVSATNAFYSGPETYIFPANAEGEIQNWSELGGSFRGSLDHTRALTNAGFVVE